MKKNRVLKIMQIIIQLNECLFDGRLTRTSMFCFCGKYIKIVLLKAL